MTHGEEIVIEVQGGVAEDLPDVQQGGSTFREDIGVFDFGPNINLTDLGNGIVGVDSQVASRVAKAVMSSDQTIATATPTTVSFDSTEFDEKSLHNGTDGFNIDESGYWYVSASVRMLDTNSGNGILKLSLKSGSSTKNLIDEDQKAINETLTASLSGVVDVTDTDVLTVEVEQTTGGDQTIDSNSLTTWFELFYIGE